MIKKFSKSKILALVTTGAIVVSTAFSFAAWNKLADKASGTIKLDQKITVTAAGFGENEVTRIAAANAADAASYEGTVKFTVANADVAKTKLALAPTITDGSTPVTEKFDIVIYKGAETTALTDNTDESITDGENSYKVKVTPKASLTEEEVTALSGKSITVEVQGSLLEKAVS